MNDFSLEYVSKTYQNYLKPITVPRVAIEALANRSLNRSSAIATQRLSLICYGLVFISFLLISSPRLHLSFPLTIQELSAIYRKADKSVILHLFLSAVTKL